MFSEIKSPIYQTVSRFCLVVFILAAILLAWGAPAMASEFADSEYLGSFSVASPISIACDGGSRLYIGSDGGKIIVTDLDGNVLDTYGGKGSELEGVLFDASAMFYYDGRLYVADALKGHVLVLTSDGRLVNVWGRDGHGKKQFLKPRGIYLEGGLIYVADTGNSRVQILGTDGVYQRNAGTVGPFEQKLLSPVDMVVSESGDMYVVDDKNNKLMVYDAPGAFRFSFIGLRNPVSVAMISNLVAVSDTHSASIKIFTAEGRPVVSLGALTSEAGLLDPINSMTFAGGVLYVCDNAGNRVVRFKLSDGGAAEAHKKVAPRIPYAEYIATIPLGHIRPGKVAAGPDGRIYVLDMETGQIVFFQGHEGRRPPAGETVRAEYDRPHEESRPIAGAGDCRASSFAMGKGGELYCLHSKGGRVAITLSGGEASGGFDVRQKHGCQHATDPVDLDVSGAGEVFIADRRAGAVLVYSPDGKCRGVLGMGGTDFYIKDPVAVRVDSKGLVYVADLDRNAILIYSVSGRLIRVVPVKDMKLSTGGFDVSDRYIFLMDREAASVRVMSKSGLVLAGFGSSGDGQGEFDSPESVAVMDDGSLIVSDHAGGGRLQRFFFHVTGAVVESIKGAE